MRCEVCDYPLWNIRDRVCPECGSPFKPSDFEFIINAVRFCCPHCGQDYYGTGDRGHLTPSEFDCVRCGRHVQMDEMVLRPTEGVMEEQTRVDEMPWLDRGKSGRFKAWFRTVTRSMIAPGRLMRTVPEGASGWSALIFAVVTMLVVSMINAAPILLIALIPMSISGARGSASPGRMALSGVFALGIPTAIALIGGLILMFLWTGATHLILRLIARPAAGLGRTFQAICYASGANIISAIPCLGVYFGWIWWVVSAVLMVKEGQKVSGARASLAVLAFPATALVVGIGLYAWFVFWALSMSASGGLTSTSGVQSVATALQDWAQDHDGAYPDHAIRLVQEGLISAASLLDPTGSTPMLSVPVGSTTLDNFEAMTGEEQAAVAQEAVDALPPNVVAYRLGDVVFTYPGIDGADPDPGLWILVRWPDPDHNPINPATESWVIVKADGTTSSYRFSGLAASPMAAKLEQQNLLRKRLGLPPLPHPSTVTHDAPAVAGP